MTPWVKILSTFKGVAVSAINLIITLRIILKEFTVWLFDPNDIRELYKQHIKVFYISEPNNLHFFRPKHQFLVAKATLERGGHGQSVSNRDCQVCHTSMSSI